MKTIRRTRAGSAMKRRTKQTIFYWSILALPLLQFGIFYVGVNFNSLLLAFRQFDVMTNESSFVGFSNFAQVFRDIGQLEYLHIAFRNSLLLCAVNLVFGTGFALLFSYYIYKKRLFAGMFKVFLFIPHIISAVIMVTIYKFFVDRAIPYFAQTLFSVEMSGLLADPDTVFGTVLFFAVWVSFGTQTIMYTGAMSGISDSVVEAAKLDGVTPLKEFWFITLPSIFPTVVTFVVVCVAGIFTNQMHLYSFYGQNAEYKLYNIGYFLYSETQSAAGSGYYMEYPYLSAFGLVLTCIAVPLTLIVRWAMNKFGPKAD